MFAVQLAFLAFGVVAGAILGFWLRRSIRARPEASAQRARMMLGFGVGAAMWLAWAFVFLPGGIAWLFVGTVAALYLPSLAAIAGTAASPRRGDAAR